MKSSFYELNKSLIFSLDQTEEFISTLDHMVSYLKRNEPQILSDLNNKYKLISNFISNRNSFLGICHIGSPVNSYYLVNPLKKSEQEQKLESDVSNQKAEGKANMEDGLFSIPERIEMKQIQHKVAHDENIPEEDEESPAQQFDISAQIQNNAFSYK